MVRAATDPAPFRELGISDAVPLAARCGGHQRVYLRDSLYQESFIGLVGREQHQPGNQLVESVELLLNAGRLQDPGAAPLQPASKPGDDI